MPPALRATLTSSYSTTVRWSAQLTGWCGGCAPASIRGLRHVSDGFDAELAFLLVVACLLGPRLDDALAIVNELG